MLQPCREEGKEDGATGVMVNVGDCRNEVEGTKSPPRVLAQDTARKRLR